MEKPTLLINNVITTLFRAQNKARMQKKAHHGARNPSTHALSSFISVFKRKGCFSQTSPLQNSRGACAHLFLQQRIWVQLLWWRLAARGPRLARPRHRRLRREAGRRREGLHGGVGRHQDRQRFSRPSESCLCYSTGAFPFFSCGAREQAGRR